MINFDEGGLSVQPTPTGISIFVPGLFWCNEQPGPNLGPFPQTANITPTFRLSSQSYGGDRTGAVLLSPLLEAGTVSFTPFDHYSFLKSLEDIFGTDGYLGYAGAPGLVGFFGCVSSDKQTEGPSQSQTCGVR